MPLHLPLERTYGPAPAFAVSLVVGLAAWQLLERVTASVGRAARRRTSVAVPVGAYQR